MIDFIKIWITHPGKRETYAEAKQKGNNNRYQRHFKINSLKKVRNCPLDMKVNYFPKTDHSVIEVSGSWRKWYLGAQTSRDLTFTSLNDCIEAIALKIGLPSVKIRSARVINIELGFGMRFRENMEGIINGFISFNNFDPVYDYNRESVKFKEASSSYSVAFYDKFKQIMNLAEKREKEIEINNIRKGVYPITKRNSRKLLAEKMNKNNFSLRYEVRITNLKGCPPELFIKNNEKRKRQCMIVTPNSILENWDAILDGLNKIFCSVHFSSYNLDVGLNYLDGKGLKDLTIYESHLAAIAVGGVRSYTQLLLKRLNSNHRKENIKKRIEQLNNPPEELKIALQACRNKERELFYAKDKRIEELRKRD